MYIKGFRGMPLPFEPFSCLIGGIQVESLQKVGLGWELCQAGKSLVCTYSWPWRCHEFWGRWEPGSCVICSSFTHTPLPLTFQSSGHLDLLPLPPQSSAFAALLACLLVSCFVWLRVSQLIGHLLWEAFSAIPMHSLIRLAVPQSMSLFSARV